MFTKTTLALVPLLFASAAGAQSIGNVKGNVLVNHGTGFVAIAALTPLKIGDTVMARAGASATLSYADGCKVDVIPGTVLTLENISPCALVNTVDPNDPATGQADATGQATPGGAPPAPPLIPPVVAGALVGTAIVGGVVAGAVTISQENSASP
jgi:hypothetical protein